MFTELAPPITFSVGFLGAEVRACADTFLQWCGKLRLTEPKAQQETLTGRFSEVLATLHPLKTPYDKVIFLDTDSDWTAVFFNDKNGHGCAEHVSRLAVELKTYSIHASYCPHTLSKSKRAGVFGGTILEINGPTDGELGNAVRAIAVVYDGGWQFHEWGKRLPFERPEYYSKRPTRDRFTPQLLAEYLKSYGIRFLDESFYKPDSSSDALLIG